MKLCCGLMDGQLWDATLEASPDGGAEHGPVVVLSNGEFLSPQEADFGEFSIADATEEERHALKQAGYTMPDWNPVRWLECGGCHANDADVEDRLDGPSGHEG